LAVTRWLLGFGRPPGAIGRRVIFSFALIFLFALIYYATPRQQSFSVFASTELLSVATVSENSPDWELPLVEACVRPQKGINLPNVGRAELSHCSGKLYTHYRLAEVSARWSHGYRLTFQGIEPNVIQLVINRDDGAPRVFLDGFATIWNNQRNEFETDPDTPVQVEITNGTLLRVPMPPDNRALMPTRGFVTIGVDPNGHSGLILRNAKFEVREKLALNRKPVVVADGTLFAGDRVEFVKTPPPLIFSPGRLFGTESQEPEQHLSDVLVTDISRLEPSFEVIATTAQEYSALQLTRVGSTPTLVPVSWTQRVARDSIPAAIATLLGLLGTTIALTNALLNAGSRKGKEK
jgi:hypothetical protein